MDLGLKDKVVVCMSSASGFGKGIATEFAREGAKVVICTSEAFKAELDQALSDAQTAMTDADTARSKGDWSAYGDAQKRLNEAVKRAVEAQKKLG